MEPCPEPLANNLNNKIVEKTQSDLSLWKPKSKRKRNCAKGYFHILFSRPLNYEFSIGRGRNKRNVVVVDIKFA